MRLDKYLADMQVGTRSEVKAYIKKGMVSVDGTVVKDAGLSLKGTERVSFRGTDITYEEFEYFMLNKPAGVVSATEDKSDVAVVSLIKDAKRKDLFPVGRLDKDTEGLLLITNDGKLAHELLAPSKHVDKRYFVRLDRTLSQDTLKEIEQGVDIGDDKLTLPCFIQSVAGTELYITIHEGRFHQIKRMFEAYSAKVVFLKRVSMGPLLLDESLKPGEYRKLTENELEELRRHE